MDTLLSPEKPVLLLRSLAAQLAARLKQVALVLLAPQRGLAGVVESQSALRPFPLWMLALTGWLLAGTSAVLAARAERLLDYMPYLAGGALRMMLLWLGWLWVCTVIRSVTILAGIRCAEDRLRSLVAWTAAPFLLRDLVRLGYLLITGAPVLCPGLSGLVCSGDAAPLDLLAQGLLAQADVYLVWHAALLWVGLPRLLNPTGTQRRGRAQLTAVSAALLTAVLLKALVSALVMFMNAPAAGLVL